MAGCLIWVLRVLELIDCICLFIVQGLSMKAYNQRKEYRVQNGYMVAQGQTLDSCDLNEAYRYDDQETAKINLDVINGFTVAPLILAILNLIINIVLVGIKLFGSLTYKQNQLVTRLQLVFTYFFTPLCFPIADFEYDKCIQTSLSDFTMGSLQTFLTFGTTMAILLGLIIWFIILIRICFPDQTKERQNPYICLVAIGIILVVVYAGFAFMFLIFAFIATFISFWTAVLVGAGSIIEVLQLYCSYVEFKDAANKIGIGN